MNAADPDGKRPVPDCGELIQSLGEPACRERDVVLAQADEQAAVVVSQAEAGRAARLERARAEGAAAAAAEAARLIGTARIAVRREVLAAQSQVVEAALCELRARIDGLPATAAYRDILGRLLAECLAVSPDPVTVRCRRQDRVIIEEHARRLGRELGVEESDLPSPGVETAAGPQGRLVCRNTLADRVEQARPALLEEAGRLLFDPPGEVAAP